MKGTKENPFSFGQEHKREPPRFAAQGVEYLKIGEDEVGTLVPVADKVPHVNLEQCFFLGNRETYLTLKKRAGGARLAPSLKPDCKAFRADRTLTWPPSRTAVFTA